jgi:hypothetical protein
VKELAKVGGIVEQRLVFAAKEAGAPGGKKVRCDARLNFGPSLRNANPPMMSPKKPHPAKEELPGITDGQSSNISASSSWRMSPFRPYTLPQ